MVAGSIETHDRICGGAGANHRLPPCFRRLPPCARAQISSRDRGCDRGDPMGFRDRPPRSASMRQSSWWAAIPPARRSPPWFARRALRNAGPAISAQCLICPVLDFEDTSPSREAFAENHLLDRATLEADLADYLPEDAELADPRISPLRATKFAGLPAAIIHTAEFDPMRDEGNAYAAKLVAAGVAVEHICHDGMIHNFHAMGAVLPQGATGAAPDRRAGPARASAIDIKF